MNTDLKQISLDILRDIYGSSRRLAMYPLGHPITQETLKKPLGGLNEIFRIKHSFIIELFKDRILAEGVLLDENVYINGMSLEMKKHKLANIIFRSNITVGDLYHFLTILVARPGPFEDNVARILNSKNIKAILVNKEDPSRLFSFDKGDLSGYGQFDLEERVESIISDKPEIITTYYLGRLKNDEDVEGIIKIDFRLSFLTRFFKDSLLHLNSDRGLALINNLVMSTNWHEESISQQTILGLKRLFDDFLSENTDESILSSIYFLLKKADVSDAILNQLFGQSSLLKLRTFRESEALVETLKCDELSDIDSETLKNIIFKLASSAQKGNLHELFIELFNSLSSPIYERRQKAGSFIASTADVLANGGFFDDYNEICKEAVRLALMPSDNIEPIELESVLISLAIKNSRWHEFKVLCRTLRGVAEDKYQISDKRELAKKILADLTESEILFKTASLLSEQAKSDDSVEFFDGLASLNSEETIRMLASKLTHPDINIRSRMIKLLISMKNCSSDILTQLLAEKIERPDASNVTEEEWYFYRNIMRVLKEAHAQEAIPYLEKISSWPITRLKLEVIKTLEGMPPEKSKDLLATLASDSNLEIKKAAIVAMGLSADGCMVPHLKDIFLEIPECRLAAVASLGRIGNNQAREILIALYENARLFIDLGISRRDSDEIRATILKALATIGDEAAMKKIAEYSKKQPDKALFGRDLLSNTAKIILGSKIR
jgi:HEAT repeat protein